MTIDPHGRTRVTLFTHDVRPHFSKTRNIIAGSGLAEWIIDDYYLVIFVANLMKEKAGVFSDPFGLPIALAGSDFPFISKFCDVRTDGQTTCL